MHVTPQQPPVLSHSSIQTVQQKQKQLNIFNTRKIYFNNSLNFYAYQIIYNIAILYLRYLRTIDKQIDATESELKKSVSAL